MAQKTHFKTTKPGFTSIKDSIKVPDCLHWLPRENIGSNVLEKMFTFEKVLGKGGTSTVYAVKAIRGDATFAVKEISREKNPVHLFNNEATLLCNLEHKGIVKLFNCALDHKYMYLITELADMDLLQKVNNTPHQRLEESAARSILRKLVKTVAWLHSKDVVHRDLKLENVVFTRAEPDYPKLIDFAQAVFVESDDQIFERLSGTIYYLSPERLFKHSGEQLKKSEVWALGIIAYEMIFGHRAFFGKTRYEIERCILRGETIVPKRKCSKACKSFIAALLNPNWKERPNVHEVQSLPWMKQR